MLNIFYIFMKYKGVKYLPCKLKIMKKTGVIIVLVLFIFSDNIFSQNDSIFAPDYKRNVIKWNATPFLLWSSRNINLSYERILKPYRSFSINAGYFVLPPLNMLDSMSFTNTKKQGGFSVSGDYRFYFKKRNRNKAPDGLFWGPYGSFHYTQFSNKIEVNASDLAQGNLQSDINIGIIGVGVELGYQFVIKEKFTIDLIFMGPSVSMYAGKITLDGNMTIDKESEYLKAIRDMLLAKFPFLDDLAKEGEFTNSGFSSSMGYGMRYMIQFGFRF